MNSLQRRISGLVFGSLMGLSYGLASQVINQVILPGVPLYQPPPGRFAAILLATLGGGLLGLLACWPQEAITGVINSGLAGALVATLQGLERSGTAEFANRLIVMVITFLPRALLFIPIGGFARWAGSLWLEPSSRTLTKWQSRGASAAIVVGAGVLGMLNMYSGEVRQALTSMNILIQSGMDTLQTASSPQALPAPLLEVEDFVKKANGAYVLDWNPDTDQLPAARPPASYMDRVALIEARFETGFHFGCVFYPRGSTPICRAMPALP